MVIRNGHPPATWLEEPSAEALQNVPHAVKGTGKGRVYYHVLIPTDGFHSSKVDQPQSGPGALIRCNEVHLITDAHSDLDIPGGTTKQNNLHGPSENFPSVERCCNSTNFLAASPSSNNSSRNPSENDLSRGSVLDAASHAI